MEKLVRNMSAVMISVGLFLSFGIATSALAQKQNQASITTAEGMHQLTFDLAAGKIKVFLPDDMAAGDTISGTVTAEPKGKDEAERSANTGILNGFVIDLGDGTKVKADRPQFNWKPAAGRNLYTLISILGQNGKSVSSARVPILRTMPTGGTDFNIPRLAQAGRPIAVNGPFDGNSSNTNCSVGSQPAMPLAESPRQAIFKTPAGVTGPTEMTVAEQGNSKSGPVRVLSVSLTAGKTMLSRDERTNVHLEITGLQGESEIVPFQIVTTGTASMSGGNIQVIEIRPEQISGAGMFARDFDLTGTATGNFSVTATVNKGEPVAGGDKCKCNCEFAKPPITSDTTRGADGSGTENTFSANMKRKDCTGSKCSVSGISYSWSVGSASTATYKPREDTSNKEKFVVNVTKDGTLVITVTVTVECSDGTKCSDTATYTVKVKG